MGGPRTKATLKIFYSDNTSSQVVVDARKAESERNKILREDPNAVYVEIVR